MILTKNRFFIIVLILSLIILSESVWAFELIQNSNIQKKQISQKIKTETNNTAKIPKNGPKLALVYDNQKIPYVGSYVNVQLIVKPDTNPIQALDAVLRYDKDKLDPYQIIPLVDIPGVEFPLLNIDKEKGEIKISMVLFEEPIYQNSNIAEIYLNTLNSGLANIWLDFDYGKTTDSNVVISKDVNDSLIGVENLQLNIQ
jgi:hypothetical protein